MADKPGPSGPAVLPKTKKVTLNKPGGNDARKLKMKPGGRNLLPSKVTVGQTSGSNKVNGAAKPAPVKPKPLQPSVPQPKSETQLLDAYYGNYLQSFLENALLEDMRRLQQTCQVDSMASKCTDVTIMAHQMNKVFADRNATKITASLGYLKTIRSAFDNLVDFTGEETLMEIHSILTSKYEKLRIEGAVIDEPLFQENELETIINALRTQACKNDETKVMGWCSEYVGRLKQLTVSSEKSIRNSELLEEATRVLLEKCSLLACDIARKSESAGEQLTDGQKDPLQNLTGDHPEGEGEEGSQKFEMIREPNETIPEHRPDEDFSSDK